MRMTAIDSCQLTMNIRIVVITSVNDRVDRRVEALVEQLPDRVEVVGDPAHQVADRLAVEEP